MILFIAGIVIADFSFAESPCVQLGDYFQTFPSLCKSVGMVTWADPDDCMEQACKEAKDLLLFPSLFFLTISVVAGGAFFVTIGPIVLLFSCCYEALRRVS